MIDDEAGNNSVRNQLPVKPFLLLSNTMRDRNFRLAVDYVRLSRREIH